MQRPKPGCIQRFPITLEVSSHCARNGIADLHILLRAATLEEIVVRKGLEAGGLSYRETSALGRVGVDEIVAVLRNVTRDRGRRAVAQLHPEAVVELSGVPASVPRCECSQEIARSG